eukprot:gene3873-4231_t
MKPTFTVKLGQPIMPGLVTTGKFDGRTPSIACVTTGGKIILHSPHESVGPEGQLNSLRYLNLNRKISAISAGRLARDDGNNSNANLPDLLFVGTQGNLLAYDVERNADAFFAEVQDGVNSLVLGRFATQAQPLVIAGGNCSILGFDSKGSESFWTVTGDNISAMTLYDMDNTNFVSPYLLVGSDDFEIRVFYNEEMVTEISEADRVTVLHAISGSRFAYGLANGTVGVYANIKTRLWRVKTKHQPTALLAYDIDLDGVAEIFSGWNNGSFNVRRQDTGEVLFRGNLSAPIAAIIRSDYRMDGSEEVIVISEAGEMVAYLPTNNDFGSLFESGIGKEDAADQKMLDELHKQKMDYISELRQLELTAKLARSSDLPVGALPPNTQLSYAVTNDLDLHAILLKVEVNTDVQIVNLIAVDVEGNLMAEREVLAISPRTLQRQAVLPLTPSRNIASTIRLQTHLSTRSQSTQLIVEEKDLFLPKFAAFVLLDDLSRFPVPKGSVTFTVKDSLERIIDYINDAFLLPRRLQPTAEERMRIGFMSVAQTLSGLNGSIDYPSSNSRSKRESQVVTGEMLVFSLQRPTDSGKNNPGNGNGNSNGAATRVKLYCESMDLAADVIQDLSKFCKWNELESEASFDLEYEAFDQVLKTVNDCNVARTTLTADMAEESQRIKALVIRAEDSRLMHDMQTMRKAYTDLMSLNGSLLTAYQVRANNHEMLLTSLKEVNQMIQKAANLRLGVSKSRLISESRVAVKNNNMQSLLRILRYGFDPGMAPSK